MILTEVLFNSSKTLDMTMGLNETSALEVILQINSDEKDLKLGHQNLR